MNQSGRTGTDSQWPAVRSFTGGDLLQIAMPMGGIGAGTICLSGHGGIQDFAVRNRPTLSALPDGHMARDAAFGLLRVVRGGKSVTRLLEGPLPVEKIYDQGLQAQGYRHGGHEGLPRFRECRFHAGYPAGRVELADPSVPLAVDVVGWSPFIPLDDHNSSLPCAVLEYTFRNTSSDPAEVAFSYHLSNLANGKRGLVQTNRRLDEIGVVMANDAHRNDELHGSSALAVAGHRPAIKGTWLRGNWFDWISALWREVSEGRFEANEGGSHTLGHPQDRIGGSVQVAATLAPGESLRVPVVIAWHFPNCNVTQGVVSSGDADSNACCGGTTDCCVGGVPAPKWRPYYAGHFADAGEVARYVAANYESLRARTLAFARALLTSTLPAEVLDAVSSNLAILKSPTVLRQENGNMWAWEGCFAESGCCAGTCTHVWNYAQALPHLFPKLERTLREQELVRSMDESGHVTFRAALPDGPTHHNWHAAADGQLGGILKLYRDWRIGGDTAWMQSLYPLARRSLEYAIRTWDPDERGALFEPHHNTYDIEFWGPDGMCTSIYIGALSAMACMAAALGESADAQRYDTLAKRGAQFMDAELFNGEYYCQKVMWEELKDQSFVERLKSPDLPGEMKKILEVEGPRYQYGNGCLSDGVIGAWMATEYGVETPMNRNHVRSTLSAIVRHNFRQDLFDHACTQRPGYALGHEPGLLLCSWPRGDKPTLPFVYSDEVWTGIEYQVASHLAHESMVDEALSIVRAVRSRYDGHVRNPFNEYECGSYYARAMASYAVLTALSGFRYSPLDRTLHLWPKISQRPFRCFFATATAFGTVQLNGDGLQIDVIEGKLAVERIVIEGNERAGNGTASPGRPIRL